MQRVMESYQSDKRESIRVSTECPAIYRVVLSEDAKMLSQRKDSIYQIPSLPLMDSAENLYRHAEETDPEVVDMLLWLDWKTSFIVKLMLRERDAGRFPHQATILSIGATGFLFYATEAYKPEMLLEFNFILPVIPFREMILTGTVVRCNTVMGKDSLLGYEVGVSLISVTEVDREHMIRYVVKRQMQLQRERQK